MKEEHMLTKLQRWMLLIIVSSVLFLITIDVTVLYTALPRLTHDLAAAASERLWIVNAYPLIMAGFLPVGAQYTLAYIRSKLSLILATTQYQLIKKRQRVVIQCKEKTGFVTIPSTVS